MERRGPTSACPWSSPREEGDQVLEGTQIFLEPDAAEFLDNKLLDADVEGEEVRFSLDVQAESL